MLNNFESRCLKHVVPVILTLTLTGCHVLKCRDKKATVTVQPIPVQATIVQVGGYVDQAGGIPLGDGVDNLSSLLSIVGLRPSAPSTQSSSQVNAKAESIFNGIIDKLTNVRTEAEGLEIDEPVPETFQIAAGIARRIEFDATDSKPFNLPALRDALKTEELFVSSPNSPVGVAITEMKRSQDKVEQASSSQNIEGYKASLNHLIGQLNDHYEIATAGSRTISQSKPTLSWDALLVRIRRRGQDYFYPYTFSRNGPAGDIRLKHGDLITVEQIAETVLTQTTQVDSGSGFVFYRGARSSTTDYPTMGRVLSKVESTRLNSILLRRRSGNLQNNAIFILPCEDIHGVPFDELRTVSDDSYEVISLLDIPLLRDSLIRNAAAGAVAANIGRIERRRPVLTEHEKKMRRLSEHHQNTSSRLRSMVSALPLIP